MSVALIQGGSGSLGTHLARQILSRSALNVVVTSRKPEEAKRNILDGGGLKEEQLTVLDMDVMDESTIEKAAHDVQERFGPANMRLLLNVSGVLHADKAISRINMEEVLHSYQINTFGHLLTYKHFVPMLPKAADVRKAEEEGSEDLAQGLILPGLSVCASLTARVGSIGDNRKGGWIGYRSSKAATNQVIKSLHNELTTRATPSIAIALHPGTVVGTNLSEKWTRREDVGKEGIFEPEESSRKLIDVIKSLGKEDGGRFLDWAGKTIVW